MTSDSTYFVGKDIVARDVWTTVPLDWNDPDGETIEIFAREFVAAERRHDDLPLLLHLQGGPGGKGVRPVGRGDWVAAALSRFRLIVPDQRGTGRSTPLSGSRFAEMPAEEAARRLSLHRADSIVRDFEALRAAHYGGRRWLYDRPLKNTEDWIKDKFKNKPEYVEANSRALLAGHKFGEMTEIFTTRYKVEAAKLPKGIYRNISGNEATALGFLAASVKSGLPLFLGSYPITPASEILQYLSSYKNFGVKTVQAEDEIAGITSAIGAAFAGNLALTTTSGPGLSLKIEAIGLAVMTELPIVIVDVQRGGPSTGLPTKTEQADLFQAIYGRNGEAPVCVLAARTPRDCFYMAIEASRIALKYMTPVILLTDGYLANGSEPWRVPHVKDLAEIPVKYRTDPEGFYPYLRNENLARPWAIPGTPGLEHRIGGLEKADVYGSVSYDPDNHDKMVKLRTEKVRRIANDIPDLEVDGDDHGDLLVLGWGSTYGSIKDAVIKASKLGYRLSQAHLRYLHPMPKNTAQVLKNFKTVLVPEINLGQLAHVLRSEYLIPVEQLNVVRGLPLKVNDILEKIKSILGGGNGK